MADYRRRVLLWSTLIMAVVATLATAVTVLVLNRTGFEEQRERLVVTAQSQARLVEAIARFAAEHEDVIGRRDVIEAALAQITDAHEHYEGFGRTGEFTLGELRDNHIIFLISHRHEDAFGTLEHHAPVPMSSPYAEPMRRALRGLSGTVVGMDYRGETVLAAHEPVSELNFGIVAKIDLSEIRAPFLRAGLLAAVVAALMVILGGGLMLRVCNPLIARLEVSEARTRGIVESAADAIITISESGIIESYNAAAAAMFDYPQEQVIGRSINRLMPSPYREEHDGYIERYLRTGEARIIGRSRGLVARRRDGTNFPIELAVSEVTLGNRRTFTGIITDMTVRKQTEDALRESEGRQSLILGSVPMALYAADPPPTFDTTWVSEQILVLSGFPPDRFVKDPKLWARRLHPDDRERVFRELTALREDKTVASEYRWQCADGEYRWFLDQPVLIRDEAGQPREIIGTWLDIDERKRAEHELRITQFAVDHAGEAIFWVGPDARFFAVNDAACRSLGYSREELLTMTVHDIDPNYPLEAWEEAWGEFRERRFATIESSNRSREGRVFPVEVAVNFMEFDGREFVCAFVRDITERKRAAEELRKAMESAEAASRAKSTFLANVSHEIRTPITAMLAAAEALAGQEATELSTSQQVDMVVRNGRHLLALVDDLLDLSRVEAGRHEIRRTRADLLEIIADVNAAIEPLHRRPEVQFRILYDTPLPGVITTDATRLKQAIINLVKNALKFTAVGHVRLRIAADADAPDPRLTATVEDSGVGISDRDQPRIFEAFTQAEPGTAKFREGVGLGLPLSRWIAEELGGSLEVTSESGRGSRFTLRVSTGSLDDVEWLSPQEAEQRVEALRGGASPKSPARLSGTVLLAEDFTDTRVLIADTLAGRGVTVTAVENGRAAVDAAMDTPFDLILMDVRMPVMDGLAATREIRRRGCLSPIIALTASRGTSSRPHLMEAGFDDLWAKPIALDTLIARVGTYLPAPDDTDAGTGGIVDPATTVPPDRRRLQQAVAEFVGSLHDRTARLREALEAHDLNEAREILHQLVGAGGLHGLPWLSDEAARLLVLAKDGKLDRCPGELEAFYAMVDRAASAVGDEGTRSA